MRYFVWVKLTRESVATIREALESELCRMFEDSKCDEDYLYCVMLMDALNELPIVK